MQRDTLGRSTGYTYAKNNIPQQQTTIGYGADGRIASAGFTHQGEHKDFIYSYLPGTHLLHTLTHPNGLTLTQSYEPQRDLPTQMDYTRADALVVQRAYTYDILGRPTARHLARYGTETSDTFGYNTRSELTSAHVNSADYTYAYDAIGNRAAAVENSSGVASRTEYRTNNLNQYTAEGSFCPTFDADGNQTLIKTSTGIWNVTYNAKNRPVRFEKTDSSIVVECTYDTMGRRATKKVTTNGTLTEHRRFLYRGYLQIDSPPPHRRLTPSGQSRFAHCPTGLTAVGRLACCDLTRAYTPALWYILWDPTQPTATRPLAIQKNGTWYTYGWDLTKNICETYRTDGRIDLAYTYTPYGEVSPAHTYDQPLRWSSEYHDTELGLVYYNYRHYNPAMGRWMGWDPLKNDSNLYACVNNNSSLLVDRLGLLRNGAIDLVDAHYIEQHIDTIPIQIEEKYNDIYLAGIWTSSLSLAEQFSYAWSDVKLRKHDNKNSEICYSFGATLTLYRVASNSKTKDVSGSISASINAGLSVGPVEISPQIGYSGGHTETERNYNTNGPWIRNARITFEKVKRKNTFQVKNIFKDNISGSRFQGSIFFPDNRFQGDVILLLKKLRIDRL